MKKFKNQRKSLEFEYEFEDGAISKFKYLEPTTKHIDKSIKIKDTAEQMKFTKEVLVSCLVSDDDGAIDKLVDEQTENGNIYDFSKTLSDELGKLKKSE